MVEESGVGDIEVAFNQAIKELIQVRQFLTEGHELMKTLFDAAGEDAPSETVTKARLMIKVIRHGLEDGDPIRQAVTDLRDGLVAGVYASARDVRVEDLADDAGYGTAYVSRVAHRFGMKRRTQRRRKASRK